MKKIFAYMLLFASLFTACKDDDPVVVLSPFEKVTLKVITDNSAKLTINDMLLYDSGGPELESGAIIIYKTNTATYGKMKIVSLAESGQNAMVIDLTNYNADGTVKSEVKNLSISSSAYCDLDTGLQTNDSAIADFQVFFDFTSTYLKPRMNTGFFIYSN